MARRCATSILLVCLAAIALCAGTGLAMQFRGSGDEAGTHLDKSSATQQMPDADSNVVDEEASHDVEAADHEMDEAVDDDAEVPDNVPDAVDGGSAVGEMDSAKEASFVQQASKGEAVDANASKGEMDSLDAEADPMSAVDDADAAAGDDNGVGAEEDSAIMERADDEDNDMASESMGGEAVDQEIQPHKY